MYPELPVTPDCVRGIPAAYSVLRCEPRYELADAASLEYPRAFQTVQLFEEAVREAASRTWLSLEACLSEQCFYDSRVHNGMKESVFSPAVMKTPMPSGSDRTCHDSNEMLRL